MTFPAYPSYVLINNAKHLSCDPLIKFNGFVEVSDLTQFSLFSECNVILFKSDSTIVMLLESSLIIHFMTSNTF